MKKLLIALCFMILSLNAHAFYPMFYWDEAGQITFKGNENQHDCFKQGYFYWDGQKCQEVIPIKSCLEQNGEWHQFQIQYQYFKNTCICPKKTQFWDGMNCVEELPQSEKCSISVWCEKKMSDIILNVTPKALDLKECPKGK